MVGFKVGCELYHHLGLACAAVVSFSQTIDIALQILRTDMTDAKLHRFRRLGMLTVAAVYCLILIAGAVRATGSGMGCPDWPTCFGQWIPPTQESQLPDNYQQIYAERGYANTAFNAKKTWIEYSNRLVGVLIGILIFLTLLASRHFRTTNNLVTRLSVAAFFAVVFQGWLGSRVVASNLHPAMVTVHMLLAQVIVALLICAVMRSQKEVISTDGIKQLPDSFRTVLMFAMGMTLLQMIMGTQVREAIDIIARSADTRSIWIEQLPLIFKVHRSFSSLILFTNLWCVYQVWKHIPSSNPMRRFTMALGGLIVSTIIIGVIMDRLSIPAFVQPLHLCLASLIFGVQITVYLFLRYGSQRQQDSLSSQTGDSAAALVRGA